MFRRPPARRLLSRMGEGGFSWRGTSLEKPGEGLALVDQPPDPHPSPLGSFLAKRRSPLPKGERGRSRPCLRSDFQGEICKSDCHGQAEEPDRRELVPTL